MHHHPPGMLYTSAVLMLAFVAFGLTVGLPVIVCEWHARRKANR